MEKEPQFIKQFSKEKSPEERQQTAQKIKAKRAEHFAEKNTNLETNKKLQEDISKREQVLAEELHKIDGLKNNIEQISSSGLNKLLNYFELKRLRADIAVGQKSYEELRRQQEEATSESGILTEKLNPVDTPPKFQEAKRILDSFYGEQKEKWANSEYSKEDITKQFSEENLKSLSSEDYALLLKRFPGEMVAHVTRQGIRDHIGMMDHTAGKGEYTDGFMKMVADGRLRSPLGVYLMRKEKDKAIAEFLDIDRFKTEKEALEYLQYFTDPEAQGGAGSYTDRMAVHLATEEVADQYYGSERGNEIFIAYPSAYIASQYYFNGQLSRRGGGYHNDQWVWASEEKGLDMNAGLVFIPEETSVDKNTGSRYELDENKKPVINRELASKMKELVDSPDFYEFAKETIEKGGWNEKEPWKLEPYRSKLEKEFGFTDQRIQSGILDYYFLKSMISRKEHAEDKTEDDPKKINSLIESQMEKYGVLYTESKNTASAKEFWENYFTQHPNDRPSKVIYYTGGDPTSGLDKWRDQHGIEYGWKKKLHAKKEESKDFGFEEKNIKRYEPPATAGMDRFRTLSEQVIKDHFNRKNVLQ